MASMIKRMLGSDNDIMAQSQRYDLFHTRCLVKGHLCMVIVNGENCASLASARMVIKMNLPTTPHPHPYKLQWLGENEETTVSHQVEVPISIGSYDDVVLCDVVPMEACHILLGKPWHFAHIVVHKRCTNRVSFLHQGKKRALLPLSSQEIYEDLKSLREKILREKESEEKRAGKEKEAETERKRKEIEKRKEEQKESEKEKEKEKEERKEEVEEEKKSEKIQNANVIFPLDSEFYLQGKNSKKRRVDIIPHAPLLIQPSFGSQQIDETKSQFMEHWNVEDELHLFRCNVGLCLFKKSILPLPLKSRLVKDGEVVGCWKSTAMAHSLEYNEDVSVLAFLSMVFDPGGLI